MDDKFYQIEEALSNLSTDLAQFLARVASIQQSIASLKADMERMKSQYDATPDQGNMLSDQAEEETVEESPQESITCEPVCITSQETPLQPCVSITDEPMPQREPDIMLETNAETLLEESCNEVMLESTLTQDDPDPKIISEPEPLETQENASSLPPIPPLASVYEQGHDYNAVIDMVYDREDCINEEQSETVSDLDDLRKLFTINDRYRFRRELFGNDNGAMTDTINMISVMKSISEAEEYVYFDLEWDKSNEEVKAFMDIVTFYFMRKK